MNQPTKLRSYSTVATLFAVVWLLSGCISPHTSPRCPEIRGKVVDAKTHLPIKGAKVCFIEPPFDNTTYTDAEGCFVMKASKNFHWQAGADSSGYPPPKSNGLRITHENYLASKFWPGTVTTPDPMNIRLTPKP